MVARRTTMTVLAAVAAVPLALVTAPQATAAVLPGVTFFTGANGTGTATTADLDDGTCHELPEPALSYSAFFSRSVDVFFNPGCRPGAPGGVGDLQFATGTLNAGNFPWPGRSYRAHVIGR